LLGQDAREEGEQFINPPIKKDRRGGRKKNFMESGKKEKKKQFLFLIPLSDPKKNDCLPTRRDEKQSGQQRLPYRYKGEKKKGDLD